MSTVKKTAIVLNNLYLLPVLIFNHMGGKPYNTYADAWTFKNTSCNIIAIPQRF